MASEKYYSDLETVITKLITARDKQRVLDQFETDGDITAQQKAALETNRLNPLLNQARLGILALDRNAV